MTGRSLILDTTVRLVFDAVLVFSVYLLFAGHNQPGGGFVGGLVAAAAIVLRYLADGDGAGPARTTLSIKPWTYLAVGLALSAGTALAPLVGGGAPLDQRAFDGDVALLGHVKVTTATVFDTGVYLIVVGLVLMILEGLGDAATGPDDGPGDRS